MLRFIHSLALRLESLFSLPEGKLLKMQAEQSVKNYKLNLKQELINSLIKNNAFWSYANVSINNLSDEELIEKTFVILDLKDISKLFELYPRSYVKQVWKERMAIQGDYLQNLNVMIAMYYFDIKNPERFLAQVEKEYISNILSHA